MLSWLIFAPTKIDRFLDKNFANVSIQQTLKKCKVIEDHIKGIWWGQSESKVMTSYLKFENTSKIKIKNTSFKTEMFQNHTNWNHGMFVFWGKNDMFVEHQRKCFEAIIIKNHKRIIRASFCSYLIKESWKIKRNKFEWTLFNYNSFSMLSHLSKNKLNRSFEVSRFWQLTK